MTTSLLNLAKRVSAAAADLQTIAGELAHRNDNPRPVVVPLCQRHPAWAGDPLGRGTGLTIGSDGCALTTLAMLASMFDPNITPSVLQNVILPMGGMNGAYLSWGVIQQLYPELTWDGMVNWNHVLTEDEFEKVRTQIELCPTPLWVDYNQFTTAQETHFVLATEMIGSDDIAIIDPIDGFAGPLLQRYGNRGRWTARRALYGMRCFHLSPGATYSFSPVEHEYDTCLGAPAPYHTDEDTP